MNKLHILRQVTKPMTGVKVAEIVRSKYGLVRENVSRDDVSVVLRAQVLSQRKADEEEQAASRPRRALGF